MQDPSCCAVAARPLSILLFLTLACAIGAEASASTLDYRIRVSDPDAETIEVSLEMKGYPFTEASFLLADPPLEAEKYFAFFEDVSFRAGARALEPEALGPGGYHVKGLDGSLSLTFQLRVRDLERMVGSGVRVPSLSGGRLTLPLETVLPLLSEVETRGARFEEISVGFELPEGWEPITVWPTYDGVAYFHGDPREARASVAVAGAYHVIDRMHEGQPILVVIGGGDAAARRAIDGRLIRLFEVFSGFMSSERSATIFVVDMVDGLPAAAKGFGSAVRLTLPPAYAHVTPEEAGHGTDAYRFYRELAHETFHRWIGAGGFVRPLGGEAYWVVEGAADYMAALAVVRAELAPASSFAGYVEGLAGRLAKLPNRADAIDAAADVYRANGAYRELLLVKAPLIFFLLDTQLRRLPSDARLRSLDAVISRLVVTAFMRGGGTNLVVSEPDLANLMKDALGMRGPILVGKYARSDIYPHLGEKAREFGLDWTDGEEGPTVRLSGDPDAPVVAALDQRGSIRGPSPAR